MRGVEDKMFRGKIITVTSMKGGVGKTEVALNLAVALKKKTGKKILVADFDIPYGGVSQALALDRRVTLSDWIRTNREITPESAKSLVIEHPSGVDFIPAIASREDVENLTENLDSRMAISRVLEQFTHLYDIVIADTGVDLSSITKTVLTTADDVVIVTTPSNVSIWNNHQYKEDLVRIGIDPHRMSLFINQVPKKNSEINVKKIIEAYEKNGISVYTSAIAYYDEAIRKLRNKQSFIYIKKTSSNFSRAIDSLMENMGLYSKPTISGVGFFVYLKQVFSR